MAEIRLCARNLEVSTRQRRLVGPLDLELGAGEIVALVGPSGAGKSTILRALNRLAELDPQLRVAGQVRLDGVDSHQLDGDTVRRRLALVQQQPTVFPRSIRGNLELGLAVHGVARRERPTRIHAALEATGLWDEVCTRLDEPASILSVGQQQRLCLARALVLEPRVLLLDEPTSALDATATARLEELFLSLRQNVPSLLVTHDEALACRLADRILRLVPGPDGASLSA
jgi:phosphate transport system ATP-binding protein